MTMRMKLLVATGLGLAVAMGGASYAFAMQSMTADQLRAGHRDRGRAVRGGRLSGRPLLRPDDRQVRP